MKKTILAAAVAISFAGVTQAADLNLNIENDAVTYDSKTSTWVVAKSTKESVGEAQKLETKAKAKEYSYVNDAKATVKLTADALDTLVKTKYKTQFDAHALAVTANTDIVDTIKANNVEIKEQEKKLGEFNTSLAKAATDQIKLAAFEKTVEKGKTEVFTDSDGNKLDVVKDANGTVNTTPQDSNNSTPGERMTSLNTEINELKAEIKLNEDAGALLAKDAVKKASALLVAKAALEAEKAKVAKTSLGVVAAQANADVKIATENVVKAKIATVDAHTAKAVNTKLAELASAKIDENGDIVTLDENGDVDATLVDVGNANVANVAKTADWAANGVVANNKAIVKTAAFANENRTRIVANEATLVEHDGRIRDNKANIEKLEMNFADLSADFYEFKSVASKGIAGVAAMSQIDSVYAEVGEVFVGAGVGSFNSEGAVAIGVGYRYSEATSFRAAGSFASGDAEPVFAAGVTYTFK